MNRLYLLLLSIPAVVSTLSLGACSATTPSWLAWQDSVSTQHLEFTMPAGSDDLAYSRAVEWLDEAGAERTSSSSSLIEAPPTERTSRIGYTVRISSSREATTIDIDYDWKPRELYEFTAIGTADARARDLARYIRTGERYDQFAQHYVPDSATVARVAQAKEERPSRVWVGGGVDEQDPWLVVGLRQGWFGASYTFVMPDYGTTSAPPYVEGPIPADAGPIELFGGDIEGISAIGFLDLNDNVSFYGSIGGFVRTYKELRYSASEERYYLGDESPRWRDGMISFGLGVQVTLFRHLVISGGYATATGGGGGIGIRF